MLALPYNDYYVSGKPYYSVSIDSALSHYYIPNADQFFKTCLHQTV